MLIAVRCGQRQVVLDVENFIHLRAECAALFQPFIQKGMELDLCYVIPHHSHLDQYQQSKLTSAAITTLSPSARLLLNDTTTTAATSPDELAFVRCPASFETFIALWERDLRPQQAAEQAHQLPTLFVVQAAPMQVPSLVEMAPPSPGGAASAASSSLVTTAAIGEGNSQGVAAAGTAVSRNKAAPRTTSRDEPAAHGGLNTTPLAAVPRDAAVDVHTSGSSRRKQRVPSNDGAPTSRDAVDDDGLTPNQRRAKALLASFAANTRREGPTIRAVMRCGEASVVVPFDPQRPPTQRDLLATVRNAMLQKLRDTEAALGARSPHRQRTGGGNNNSTSVIDVSSLTSAAELAEEAALQALAVRDPSQVVFVLGAMLNPQHPIDIDDDGDVRVLADAVRAARDDYSVYLVVESHDAADPSILAMPNAFFFGAISAHEVLSPNRSQSPCSTCAAAAGA